MDGGDRKGIEVGSGGFGSEEVSEWWFLEVLCEGEGSGRVGCGRVWWVLECLQVQRKSGLVWCVQ